VEKPQGKPSLADDPRFLASLSDLDRGLDVDDEGNFFSPPPQPRQTMPVLPRVADRVKQSMPPALPPRAAIEPHRPPPPLPAPVVATPSTLPPLVVGPGSRRPLLDLFPVLPNESLRPPGPALGTAVGPNVPEDVGARHLDRPADPLTYETFYGLHEPPFGLSTDPKFLYHSASHDRVAQELLTAIRRRDGLVVVTGPLGAGKSMLCRVITEEVDRRTLTSVVFGPITSLDDLLRTILVDFGVISREDLVRAPQAATREGLTATLQSFLTSLEILEASAMVIIDEAQHLPIEVLQGLPSIALDGDWARTLQLVLVGEPSLTRMLKRREMRGLSRVVATRAQLGPLTADEMPGYVMHRLGVAGAQRSRVDFADAALKQIFELSGGLPRRVNLLCARALALGAAASASVISTELVEAASTDLDLRESPRDARPVMRTLLTSFAFVLLMAVGAAAALWVFHDAVARTIIQWERLPQVAEPQRSLPLQLKAIPPADL
jgi:type II secretory pathway predicted ATPase ExeA